MATKLENALAASAADYVYEQKMRTAPCDVEITKDLLKKLEACRKFARERSAFYCPNRHLALLQLTLSEGESKRAPRGRS